MTKSEIEAKAKEKIPFVAGYSLFTVEGYIQGFTDCQELKDERYEKLKKAFDLLTLKTANWNPKTINYWRQKAGLS